MRFHSKNRSQSAVSEPTRLSMPFEAMSSALNQESCGIFALWCVRFSSNAARGHTRLLQLDDHQRQAVDEADQIRAAGVKRASDAELADQQEIIAAGYSQSMTRTRTVACPPRSLSATEIGMPSFSNR